MDENRSDQIAWLSKLSPFDQNVARREIKRVGEGVLRRIAIAITQSGASRGAPKKLMLDEWVLDGYRRWLTTEDLSLAQIAKEVIDGIETVPLTEREGRARALASRLKRDVVRREKCCIGDLQGGFLLQMHELEWTLAEAGTIARDGYAKEFQDGWAKRSFSELRRLERQKREIARVDLRPQHLLNKQAGNDLSSTNQSRVDLPAMRREVAFYEAFEDLIPGILPVTKAQELYRDVRMFLQERCDIEPNKK